MPQTNEGILLMIGAVFLILGSIGGGVEISAIKIPPISKWARILFGGLGAILILVGLFRLVSTPNSTISQDTVGGTSEAAPLLTDQSTITIIPSPTSIQPIPTAAARGQKLFGPSSGTLYSKKDGFLEVSSAHMNIHGYYSG